MKNKISIVLFVSVLMIFSSYGKQNPHWKGTIEEEDGVKVIKNPNESLYGEITFDLEEDLSIGNEEDENYVFYKFVRLIIDPDGNIFALDGGNGRIQKFNSAGNYIQTIGRKGQGPGEFSRPLYAHLDEEGNIYVIDATRKMHIFDKTGKFRNSLSLSHSIREFERTSEGNFLAQTLGVGKKNGKPVMLDQVSLLDSECKILKTIASLPMYTPPPPPQPINIAKTYSPRLIFYPLNAELGVYAISSEYKLYIVNSSGIVSYAFSKDESPQPFSKTEKENIIDSFKKSIERSGEATKFTADFPTYKPFFLGIRNDDKGRIYVHKFQIIPKEDRIVNYDLFNKQGYYLYKAKIPIFPQIIKNAYLYTAEPNPETGYAKIKRYRIKNWDQIKEH